MERLETASKEQSHLTQDEFLVNITHGTIVSSNICKEEAEGMDKSNSSIERGQTTEFRDGFHPVSRLTKIMLLTSLVYVSWHIRSRFN